MAGLEYPVELAYHREHTWVKVEGSLATVGITAVAQEQLGNVVFVDLPGVGMEIVQGRPFGAIESLKSTSDLVAPVSGQVAEVNRALEDAPDLVNYEPYGAGWIIRVKLEQVSELQSLLDNRAYSAQIQEAR